MGGGDDMAKSPHLARIANSIFPDHCGDADPRCNNFGFYRGGEPTPMMEKSLLYKLVMNGQGRATVDTTLFEEVHKTRYGYMRIYKVHNVSQKSKNWAMDPANRKCDAPGSWYCEGQYPPSIEPLIKRRRNFAQLEDFNKKGGAKSAYSKLIEEERAQGKRARKRRRRRRKRTQSSRSTMTRYLFFGPRRSTTRDPKGCSAIRAYFLRVYALIWRCNRLFNLVFFFATSQ